MSANSLSLDFPRKLAIASLFGATCLAAPLTVAHAQSVTDPVSSSYSQTTTTTSTAPAANSYSTTTATKSVDANGAEVEKNKTYVSGPDGTRASSTTEVHTPDGGSVTSTHQEYTNNPTVATTSTHTSTSTSTDIH